MADNCGSDDGFDQVVVVNPGRLCGKCKIIAAPDGWVWVGLKEYWVAIFTKAQIKPRITT